MCKNLHTQLCSGIFAYTVIALEIKSQCQEEGLKRARVRIPMEFCRKREKCENVSGGRGEEGEGEGGGEDVQGDGTSVVKQPRNGP